MPSTPGHPGVPRRYLPRLVGVESCALRLLACAASAVLVICLIVLVGDPSEKAETLSWVLSFAVALPAGLAIGDRQERILAAAAPAATARGLAAGLALLAAGLFLRYEGNGDGFHHLLLALAAAAALAAPFLAAREWRDPDDCGARGAWAIAVVSLGVLALLFVPASALRLSALLPALALAVAALALLRAPWSPSQEWRPFVDLGLCLAIVLVVVQLPDLQAHAQNLIHHQGFFLGPANDVLHGRVMLADVWSQYGVGSIDALALAFTMVPIGYGGLALILIALVTAQYLCVFATLRLAGIGQVLVALTIAVAVLGNLFAPIETYVVFPSDTALRFGLPYAMVFLAVLGARLPRWEVAARNGVLTVLAIGAVWSFEVFVYCAGTYGALVLVQALAGGPGVMRRILREAELGLMVSIAALLLFSLWTLLLAGELDWGPYSEYLRLYSTEEFGQLPVVVFSAGPLMGAAIFLSAATLVWLAWERPDALSPPLRTALAGFTGFAIATFTYFLGRSHPNGLLVLLVPLVSLGGLWTQVLLGGRAVHWRTAGAASLLVVGGMIAVASWASLEDQWDETALGIVVDGGSPRARVQQLADNPVLDPRSPAVAAMLDERVPDGEPVVVLTEPELTTEVLLRAGRRNLLPISNPSEDSLIESSADRVEATAKRVPPGTVLLTSPPPSPPGQVSPTGQYRDFNSLQLLALEVLQRRFTLEPVASSEGLELVRLLPRNGA